MLARVAGTYLNCTSCKADMLVNALHKLRTEYTVCATCQTETSCNDWLDCMQRHSELDLALVSRAGLPLPIWHRKICITFYSRVFFTLPITIKRLACTMSVTRTQLTNPLVQWRSITLRY